MVSLKLKENKPARNKWADLEHFKPMGGGCSSAVAPEGIAGQQPRKKSWCNCCGTRRTDSAVTLLSQKEGDTSQRPTPEEARAWSHNFERMLRHKYGLSVFQDFLRSQYGEENLNFWISVEEYKKTPKENKMEVARTIYEDYVSTLSPTEISLDARIRENLDRNMSDPGDDAFKPAQDHIYTLMMQDCFPRFLKSKQYKQLLKHCWWDLCLAIGRILRYIF